MKSPVMLAKILAATISAQAPNAHAEGLYGKGSMKKCGLSHCLQIGVGYDGCGTPSA